MLTAAPDTAAPLPVLAWLGYTYRQELGANLPPGELDWRRTNFTVRTGAQFDTLTLTHFAYLEREEAPAAGFYLAKSASRLASRTTGEPLLLRPVPTPFGRRGLPALGLALIIALVGSALIIFLLLVMALRPAADWPD